MKISRLRPFKFIFLLITAAFLSGCTIEAENVLTDADKLKKELEDMIDKKDTSSPLFTIYPGNLKNLSIYSGEVTLFLLVNMKSQNNCEDVSKNKKQTFTWYCSNSFPHPGKLERFRFQPPVRLCQQIIPVLPATYQDTKNIRTIKHR